MSRFAEHKPVQRCENPVRVFRDGHFNYFACGRCPACLLDKANSWSLRLANEIETFPFSIFFTLTYSNKYLPKLRYLPDTFDGNGNLISSHYTPNNEFNLRFDGSKDVLRHEPFDNLNYFPVSLPISGFSHSDFIAYCSKTDIQLWLKLLRKDIFDEFYRYETFRYYIIAELGPSTMRSHYHGVLFTHYPEIAEYLLRVSMYKNWQMCDKALFDQHTHYCDSGAAEYVTNYLTVPARLPQVHKDKSIRPFRLSSKNPSIGFSSFVPSEIFENLFAGINEYNKSVERCGLNYVFPYPSEFMHRLLPKCREYRLLSYKRLRYIYGFLWRNVFERGFSYDVCNRFIREKWFAADVTAAQKCYKVCLDFFVKGEYCNPDVYLYLVDMYYYKEGMFALKKFYEWQELHSHDVVSIMFSYTNFQEYVTRTRFSVVKQKVFALWLSGFGLTLADMSPHNYELLITHFEIDDSFRKEVSDILQNMEKMPKFNEKFGFAPTNYF